RSNLEEEKARGAFRLDFYHRIASWTCKLPSLDERREDIIPLTQHFLRQIHSDAQAPPLDSAVRDYLLLRKYPGNVRDLRQLVTRMAKRHVGKGPITVGDIPEDDRAETGPPPPRDWANEELETVLRRALAGGAGLQEIKERTADVVIRIAMQDAEGSVQRAAIRLGVT